MIHHSGEQGWSAKAEIQSIGQTCKGEFYKYLPWINFHNLDNFIAVEVSVKPASSSVPLVKRAVFYLHNTALTLSRVKTVAPGEPYPSKVGALHTDIAVLGDLIQCSF